MTIETMLVFSIALLVAAVLPGPGIVAMVARVLGSGFWTAVPLAVGMITGDLIFLTVVVLGLAALAQQLGGFFVLVKFVGAIYLVYLGYQMWTAPIDNKDIARTKASRPARMYVVGLIVTLSNPKTVLFFLALLPTIVGVTSVDGLAFAQLGTIVVVIDALVLSMYAALAAQARLVFSSPLLRKRLNRGAGTVMIGAGGAVAAS